MSRLIFNLPMPPTISWSGGTSYGFTAGDLGHISAPMTGAGTSQIGVVLRETNNFEFAVVPEKTLFLLAGLPFLPKLFGRLRKRRVLINFRGLKTLGFVFKFTRAQKTSTTNTNILSEVCNRYIAFIPTQIFPPAKAMLCIAGRQFLAGFSASDYKTRMSTDKLNRFKND